MQMTWEGRNSCCPWDCPCWEEARLFLLGQKSGCIFIWSKVEVWAEVSALSWRGSEQLCAACSATRALSTQGSGEGDGYFGICFRRGSLDRRLAC